MAKITIKEIEAMTYEQAMEIAAKDKDSEVIQIKGHNCVFLDLGDNSFKHSVLVFKNGKQIYHANEYELHHNWLVNAHGLDSLKPYYIDKLKSKLFTDEELLEPCKSYDEWQRKDYFLRNFWIQRFDTLSCFCIGEKQRKVFDEKAKDYPYFNPVSFCQVKEKQIVDDAKEYMIYLSHELEKIKASPESFRRMIRMELANHEACITGTAMEALNALGYDGYNDLTDEQAKITKEELQRQIDSYYC